MAASKVKDTKFVKVIVSNRNPEAENQSTFVGGNNIVVDGVKTIKHYRLQLDKEVELPEPFVEQLKKRSVVGKDKKGNRVNVPMYIVEEV